jgi:hypothetical protein
MMRRKSPTLAVFALLCLAASTPAQNLINVKLAGGTPGMPSGAAVIGMPGGVWNYFPNLGARANGGGVVTNATLIRDSSGTTLNGVAMNVSLSGGDGLDSYTDNSLSPVPPLIMGNYVYENAGANYWTISFTGLATNKTYLLYGLGNGTGGSGRAYLNAFQLKPLFSPVTSGLTNQAVAVGSDVTMAEAVSGVPTPALQWRQNGTNIVGATSAVLNIASTTLSDNGTYSVVVSNSAGAVASSNATITIPAQPTSLTPTFTNGALNLSWPATQTGSRLLAQTNPPGVGLTTNWQAVANSNTTNQVAIPVNLTSGSAFFRLVYP